MKYRLGLDVGTASVGLVAYELNDLGQPISVPYHSVRIFNEPLLPAKRGVGKLKREARREARSQRRQHQRRARRLRKIAYLARLLGIDKAVVARRKKPSILAVRAQSATEKVALEDLLRIFLHLSKRRGYAGTFRVKKTGDMGTVQTGIGNLEQAMNEANCKTLGEYLWHRHQNREHLRLKDAGLYADREMILREFNCIWDIQEMAHEQLRGEYEGRSLREKFREAIFYQRPIRILPAGRCALETSLPRSPMAQPVFQAFRIEKQIADLRWEKRGRRESKHLEAPAKHIIRNLLASREKVTFDQIYKALEKAGCPAALGEVLNLSSGDREDLRGNSTDVRMRKLGLQQEWQNLAEGHRITTINLLADTGSLGVFGEQHWHEKFARNKEKRADGTPVIRRIPGEVVNFINSLMIATGKSDWLSEMGFETGRSAYSIKALRQITTAMREKGLDEESAIRRLYPESEKSHMGRGKLAPHESTGNAVVDVSLRQVRREVNAAIQKLGTPPASVVVELSRDMPRGVKRRGEIAEKIKKNENARKQAAKEIEKYTKKQKPATKKQKPATTNQIRRYLLWSEQDKKWCPYCADCICMGDALDGSKTHYEHILPRSITRMGKKRDYIVLAHRQCNDEKGARTPREAWEKNPERWKIIEERAKQFGKKKMIGKMRQILSRESGSDLLDNEAIEEFSDRQFHETSWIAKSCAQWMKTICRDVSVSRGFVTATLRRKWGLETVIPQIRFEEKLPVFDRENQLVTREAFDLYRAYWEEKSDSEKTHRRIEKRIDHRHHLIDALVIGLTDRSLYRKMALSYKVESERAGSAAKNLRIPLRANPPIPTIRKMAIELVRNCKITHRRDRWLAGSFFDQQPLSIINYEGKKLFSEREKLIKFAENVSEEMIKNRIEKILPQSIREIVKRTFDERISSGMTPKKALSEPILQKWFAQKKKLDELAENASEKTVRNRIERIVSQCTRKIVKQAFEERISSGMTPKEALSEPILDRRFRTANTIRRVQVRRESADGEILVEHGGGLKKYLKTDGYAYLELDTQQGDPRLVTLYQIIKSGLSHSQHGVLRFFKDDTVFNTLDKKRYVIRQILSQAGGMLAVTLLTETGTFENIAASDKSTKGKGDYDRRAKRISGKSLLKLECIADD